MEVNFNELKRRDLQRLCKKHGLRANATNCQMADSLVSFFKIYEENKQGKVPSKGSGGNRSSYAESVEGDAEKVVIIIDEDEGEAVSVPRSADRKSLSKSRRSGEKDEQIEACLNDSSECGGIQGTRVKLHEESAIILLDEENEEPCRILRSADRRNARRSSRRTGKVCDASNEENQPAGFLRNHKESLPRPMASKVAHSRVIEKMKAGKDSQVSLENAELPLGTSEGEVNEVGKMKENLCVMMAAGNAKRKRNSRNYSMKVNDEIMVSLPIEASVTENLVGDFEPVKHLSTGMGSDFTYSIDGEQARQGTTIRNEQDIEEHELPTSSSLMEVVAGNVITKRGKKRTRAGLEGVGPVMEKETDKLGSSHHPEISHRDEVVEPEVCFASSKILGSPLSYNLASRRPCLLSELQGGHDGGQFPVTNVPSIKQSGSLDRNGDLEMEEIFVCKNSIIASITVLEVDDTFGRSLSTSELDCVSKEGEASRLPSAITALSYSQGHHNIKESFCSVSANHVRKLDDKFFIAETHRNRCSFETPISMNNMSLSSEHGCVTPEFTGEVTRVEARQECQEFEEIRGSEEVFEINKLFKDREEHKEMEKGSECREGYNNKITGKCDFEEAYTVILLDESIIEDILDIAAPASESVDDTNISTFLSSNIDRHSDHNLLYLAESYSETVEGEESQVVVQKKINDLKSFVDGSGSALEQNASNELEYRVETLKKADSDLLSNKFQKQAADYEQAAIVPTMKIETDSSDMRSNLELQELIVFGNLAVTRNTWIEEKNDSCDSKFSSSYTTKIYELEQESKGSLSSGKEIINPQNRVVSHVTDVSTIVCDNVCLEVDIKDAEGTKVRDTSEGTKVRDNSENRSVSPNIKILGACKALLDDEEMEDVKFLETKPSQGVLIETEGKGKENGSNLSPSGSYEKKYGNFEENFESFQKSSNSPRLAERKSGQFFAPFESVVLQEDLNQTKGGRHCNLEGNVQITQDKLKHSGEKLSDVQAVGYYEESMGKIFVVSSPSKMEEIAPFGLSKRVDNLMEKLFCLKKVLRGEIAPLIPAYAYSSLPCEEDISCEESHRTSKKEMASEESQVVNAVMPTDSVHVDCDDSSKFDINIPNKLDKVIITNSPHALQGNPELWKCMENCEGNNTNAASPYEWFFNIRSTEEKLCPNGYVDDKEFLETVQDVTAKLGEVVEDNKFVSLGKLSDFVLEGASFSACYFSKSKLNNSTSNSPIKYINHFGTHCLSETSLVDNSLPNKKAYAKHTVDILKMESHDEVVNKTSSDALAGNPDLWKCLESCEAKNNDAAFIFESECSYNGPAEAEPCQGGDINVKDFLEIAQGAAAKPSGVLEKIDRFSPSKQSRIDLGSERNSSVNCSSEKTELNNSITKDTKHFENNCLSETLGGQSSLPIKEALATYTVDVLKMESHEVAITSLPNALQGTLELLNSLDSCVANNVDAAFPSESDFSYKWHSEGELYQGGDFHIMEFLKKDQGASTNKPREVLEKIMFPSPSKQNRIELQDEIHTSTSCISKKANSKSNIINSPAEDIKSSGTKCLSETLEGHHSLPIKGAYSKHPVDILELESQDGSMPGADTVADDIPSEVKASCSSNIDPVEEISHKLINFCISSSRKAAKSNIFSTPTANSTVTSPLGLMKDQENTRNTKMKNSSKRKIRNSASAGSIRQPLQSVTNLLIE